MIIAKGIVRGPNKIRLGRIIIRTKIMLGNFSKNLIRCLRSFIGNKNNDTGVTKLHRLEGFRINRNNRRMELKINGTIRRIFGIISGTKLVTNPMILLKILPVTRSGKPLINIGMITQTGMANKEIPTNIDRSIILNGATVVLRSDGMIGTKENFLRELLVTNGFNTPKIIAITKANGFKTSLIKVKVPRVAMVRRKGFTTSLFKEEEIPKADFLAIDVSNIFLIKLEIKLRIIIMTAPRVIGITTITSTTATISLKTVFIILENIFFAAIATCIDITGASNFGLAILEINLKTKSAGRIINKAKVVPTIVKGAKILKAKKFVRSLIGLRTSLVKEEAIPRVVVFLRTETGINPDFDLTNPAINLKILRVMKPTVIGTTAIKITTGTISLKKSLIKEEKATKAVADLRPKINFKTEIRIEPTVIGISAIGINNLKTILIKDEKTFVVAIGISSFGLAKLSTNLTKVMMIAIKIIGVTVTRATGIKANWVKANIVPKILVFLYAEIRAFGLTITEINFNKVIIIEPTLIGIKIIKIPVKSINLKTNLFKDVKEPKAFIGTVVSNFGFIKPEISLKTAIGIKTNIITAGTSSLKLIFAKDEKIPLEVLAILKGTTGNHVFGLANPNRNLIALKIILIMISGVKTKKIVPRTIGVKASMIRKEIVPVVSFLNVEIDIKPFGLRRAEIALKRAVEIKVIGVKTTKIRTGATSLIKEKKVVAILKGMIGSSSLGLAKPKRNLKILIEPTDIGMKIKNRAAGIMKASFMKELNEPIMGVVVFFKDKGIRTLVINLMVPIIMDPEMTMKITAAGMISLIKDVETLLTILSEPIGINNFGLATLNMNLRTVEMNLNKIIGPRTIGRTNLMKDATAPRAVAFLWMEIRAFGLTIPEINLKIPKKIDPTVFGMKPKIIMTIGMMSFDTDMEIPFARVEDFLRAENDNSALGLTKPEINFKI